MKNININFSNKINATVPTAKKVYEEAQSLLAKKFSQDKLSTMLLEFGVNYITSADIKRLNHDFRHLDKPTDVLSFPIYRNITQIQNNPSYIINLGDIFICLPEAEKNAKEKNTTLNEEIIFLIIHGLKHLLGFHHK